jgi:hypothetical protein
MTGLPKKFFLARNQPHAMAMGIEAVAQIIATFSDRPMAINSSAES